MWNNNKSGSNGLRLSCRSGIPNSRTIITANCYSRETRAWIFGSSKMCLDHRVRSSYTIHSTCSIARVAIAMYGRTNHQPPPVVSKKWNRQHFLNSFLESTRTKARSPHSATASTPPQNTDPHCGALAAFVRTMLCEISSRSLLPSVGRAQ
jgi:hypothetical protein